MARWWLSVYQAATIPSRQDIDLVAIRRALSCVWLVEPVADESAFRYRLAGEHVNAVAGCSLRGKRLVDVLDREGLHAECGRFSHVLETPAAFYGTSRLRIAGSGYHDGERLILPLSDDGVNGTHLLGVTAVRRSRRDEREQPLEYEDEHFLEINDVLAWKKSLGLRRRA